ncbi:MAG: ISKra4 family transposase, partial [Cyanobacteria bacterium J06559_1]
YFDKHRAHVQYQKFKQQGFPLGSGMVESACKWLIQQRFKGVGMRWSEPGLNRLLHLRVAWVNQRFDALFSQKSLVLPLISPNR